VGLDRAKGGGFGGDQIHLAGGVPLRLAITAAAVIGSVVVRGDFCGDMGCLIRLGCQCLIGCVA